MSLFGKCQNFDPAITLIFERNSLTMRRTAPFTNPDESKTPLPSTSVVDMFGRLFGTILATLFEKNTLKPSTLQQPLADALSQIQSSFTESQNVTQKSISPEDFGGAFEKDLNVLKTELSILKRQNREISSPIEMISRSASFLKNQNQDESHVIPFRSKCLSDGIIGFLGRMIQGNPHDKGIISITGTPYNTESRYQPRNVVDLLTDSYFHSSGEPKQTLTYDINNMKIAVTHNLLRSFHGGINSNHPRSWVIEISVDGSKWNEIDRRDNYEGLNGPHRSQVFEVQSIGEARFVRIQQTGNTWADSNYVILCGVELFGGLRMNDSTRLNSS
jgi:hypothetical protein